MAGSVLVGLVSAVACGDDDTSSTPDGGDETGGAAATGGKGGAPATGGARSAGGTTATGGATASGGKGGDGPGTDGGTGGTTATGGTDAGSTGGAGPETDGGAGSDGGGEEPVQWQTAKTSLGAFATLEDRLYTPVFDAANNVYVTGYVNEGGDRKIVVYKYDSQAARVTTGFGTDGVVTINHTAYAGDGDNPLTASTTDKFASAEEGRDLAFQTSGKIVVAAVVEESTAAYLNRQVVVYRLNANGSIDDTFGDDGKKVIDWSPVPTGPTNNANDTVWGLDVDAGDNVLVFGAGKTLTDGITTTDRFITRLTKDGDFDASFGTGGTFTTDTPVSSANPTGDPPVAPAFLGLGDSARHGFALPGGGVAMAGYTNVGGRNQIVLWKLKNDGTRDLTFSQDGIARLAPFALGFAESYGMAVLSDGTFVTTGYGQVNSEITGANLDMVSIAIKPNGALDPAYGLGGALAYDVNGGEDRGRYAMALPGDRILFAGTGTQTAGNKDAMLLLLEKTGAPVQNFGTNGHQLYGFNTNNEEFYGAALSKDGKFIAAAGYSVADPVTDGNGFVAVLPVAE